MTAPNSWKKPVFSTWAKKGELTAILKQMGKLSAEERPVIGQLANEIRKDIEDTIANKSAEIKKRQLRRSGWLRKPWM